jgi:transposase
MGYRGKLAEQRQARRLRRAGLPLAEIAAALGVSKSSVSLWVRDVEFAGPVVHPARGRRREPNALQRRKQGEIERLLEEGRARGPGGCRSASSWSRAWRCTRGKGRNGMAQSASPTATPA